MFICSPACCSELKIGMLLIHQFKALLPSCSFVADSPHKGWHILFDIMSFSITCDTRKAGRQLREVVFIHVITITQEEATYLELQAQSLL